MQTEDHKFKVEDESERNNLGENKIEEIKYFQCSRCPFKQAYSYFGQNPPMFKSYNILEDCYIIENPFALPKQGDIVILGSHCLICRDGVCKDTCCSIYFEGTYCIACAKARRSMFPTAVQEKLNKVL